VQHHRGFVGCVNHGVRGAAERDVNTIAIDIGPRQTQLAGWDGRRLRVARVPGGDPVTEWPRWITALRPVAPYQVVWRATDAAVADRLRDVAREHGARWLRNVRADARVRPECAAARLAADRERIGECLFARIDDDALAVGRLDRRGHFLPMENATHGMTRTSENAWLVVVGSSVGRQWVEAVRRLDAGNVLIPVWAAFAGAVGLLVADIVVSIRRRCAESFDLQRIRPLLAECMDAVASAITMEGYDLDDSDITRWVELAAPGEEAGILTACETLTDQQGVLDPFRRAYQARTGRKAPAVPDVRAVEVRAVIETRKCDLPPPSVFDVHATTDTPDAPDAPEESRLDEAMNGPARVSVAGVDIDVPAGWRVSSAERGVLLGR